MSTGHNPRYRSEREIFEAVAYLPRSERAAALEAACAGNEALRQCIEELLDAHDSGAGFLRAPTAAAQMSAAGAPAGAGGAEGEGPGDLIGPYQLVERIGEGGFGVVFLAEQREPVRRRVALKVIRVGMDTAQVVARFEAERQALAMMEHPGIAHVLDAGATGAGRPFFVMELVAGRPLTVFCDEQRLPLQQRLELFIEICHAVQHAHTKGITHRDLKPTNILVSMVDGRPLPKIIDFGIAKATRGDLQLTDKTVHTELRQFVGTPQYMSPEQAAGTLGAGSDIDTRSDIYSLGVLLYELLTGTTPFDRDRLRKAPLDEIVRIIREEEPVAPSTRLQSTKRKTQSADVGGSGSGTDAESGSRQKPADRTPHATTLPPDGRSADSPSRRGDPFAICDLTSTAAWTRSLRGDLDWVALKCLEKDRGRRYQTAEALADDLRRFLNHEPVTAGPPTTTYRVSKFLRRNRGKVVLASLALGALLLGTAGTSAGLVWALRERGAAIEARQAEAEQRQLAEHNEERAREEAARALAAEAAERERADELEKVADFQAAQLSEIDVPMMGVRLRQSIIEKRRGALEGRQGQVDEAEIEAGLRELDSALAGVNFTSVALESLDETIFERALVAINEQFADQPLLRARLLQTLASVMRELGLLERASGPQSEAFDTRREILGDEHPTTLLSINNMGGLLQEQGKLTEAESYYREAMEGRRRVLGDEHPATLTSIRLLGGLLRSQGRLAEAEPYLREASDGFRHTLGSEHSKTLNAINSMAVLLAAQGRLDEAKPFYHEALGGFRRTLGDEHPHTLNAIGNMGYVLQQRGKLSEAEPYYREALEIRRRILGNEHPKTLGSMNNLGTLLQDQGKLAEAEPFARETLEVCRRLLGDEHPNTLRSIINLGRLLSAQGDLAGAEVHYRKALEHLPRILGNEHPVTLTSINNVGLVLLRQGKLTEAEPYLREALEVRRRVLGDEHPDTLNSLGNMGGLLQQQGRLAEAEPYFREALEAGRRMLGHDHPDTLTSMNNLGSLLRDLGRLEEADALGAEAVIAAQRTLPAGHWRTANALRQHARTLVAMQRFAEAEERALEAAAIFEAVLGSQHNRTIGTIRELADLYDVWHEAEPEGGHEERAAAWRERLEQLPQ